MRYTVNVFGKHYHYDLTPTDVLMNVCESIIEEEENAYSDGDRDEPLGLFEYLGQVRNRCSSFTIFVYIEGVGFEIPTPKEISSMSQIQMRKLATEKWHAYFG